MTKQIKSKGFTIVELLIVIVVIAILAAITIVAYNGIQQRAHTTAQKTTAENLAKKVEGYNAINNAYPTYNSSGTTVTAQLDGDSSTKITNNGVTLSNGAAVTSTTNSDATVELDLCSNGASALATGAAPSGYVVYIWDQTKNKRDPVQAGGNVSITVNSGTTANTIVNTGSVDCSVVAK